MSSSSAASMVLTMSSMMMMRRFAATTPTTCRRSASLLRRQATTTTKIPLPQKAYTYKSYTLRLGGGISSVCRNQCRRYEQQRHGLHSLVSRKKNQHSHHRQQQHHHDNDDNYYKYLKRDLHVIGCMLARGLSALGLIHVVSEYGMELTLCEGPSMMPTIQPRGEIILVDRLTPRIYGLDKGGNGEERAQAAQTIQNQQANPDIWYQPMIPVNEVLGKGGWKRLWQKCNSGITVGDVVVVQHPFRSGTVCKRVLGLPGDVVVEPPMDVSPSSLLVIPNGHVWIEGDNSTNSSDSRNYGPISAALIVGRVLCRVWPLRGHAMMERGARPEPKPNEDFTGSTVLPAGYEGEIIVRTPPRNRQKKRLNRN